MDLPKFSHRPILPIIPYHHGLLFPSPRTRASRVADLDGNYKFWSKINQPSAISLIISRNGIPLFLGWFGHFRTCFKVVVSLWQNGESPGKGLQLGEKKLFWDKKQGHFPQGIFPFSVLCEDEPFLPSCLARAPTCNRFMEQIRKA